MLPLTYCRKTVVKGGMVSHVGYHDTISVKDFCLYSSPGAGRSSLTLTLLRTEIIHKVLSRT
jgi:hypothetical protein